MKSKKITLLLMLTVISLLTMFLVVVLDDTVLAANHSGKQMLPNINLSQKGAQGMMVVLSTQPKPHLLWDELKAMEAV